jgi:hypothetical protein
MPELRRDRPWLLAAAVLLSPATILLSGEGLAQGCDTLVGQEVTVAGTIEKMVEATGVIFFRDKKTGCEFGLVTSANDKGCKTGSRIEVSGKLVANRFLPGTYDVDRGSRPSSATLVCR